MSDENKKRKRQRAPKTILRFIKPWAVHPAGEIAGFEPHTAQKLIDQGYAVLHNPTPAPAPVQEAPAAPVEADGAEDKAPADEPAPVPADEPAPVEEAPAAPASTKKSSSKKG